MHIFPIKCLVAAIAIGASASSVLADGPSVPNFGKGLYFAMGVGANWRGDDTLEVPVNSTTTWFNTSTSWNIGITGVGAVGVDVGHGFRLEAEASARKNRIDGVSVAFPGGDLPLTSSSGVASTTALMFNILYDIGRSKDRAVYVTVGGGIGYAWHSFNGVGFIDTSGEDVRFSGTDGGLAYQGIIGLTMPVRSVPGLELTAEYRYFATKDATFNATYSAGGSSTAIPSVSTDNENHSAIIGMRYRFGG